MDGHLWSICREEDMRRNTSSLHVVLKNEISFEGGGDLCVKDENKYISDVGTATSLRAYKKILDIYLN